MKVKAIVLYSVVLVIVTLSTIVKQGSNFHPEFKETNLSSSIGITSVNAYPPAVGILNDSKNCLACHANNGQWSDDDNTIIDILDNETKKSLKQPDGTFLIETKRWEQKTILTIIGRKKVNSVSSPYRNAWLYVDPTTIGTNSISKFAPGWDVNLPMSCRLVGDKLPGYENSDITSLSMTIQPLSNAKDTKMQLQVMLTKGESIKGNAQVGMKGNYFERKVKLKITQ